MRFFRVMAAIVVGALVCTLGTAGQNARKAAAELPEIKELPNPFTFANGSPVRTSADWERRRLELKDLFQDYMYGHMPPKPQKMTIKRGERVTDETNKVTVQDLELILEHDGKSLTLNLKVALPAGAKEKVPVVIQSTFGFGKGKGAGAPVGKNITVFTSQGYGVAEFSFNQVASDNKNSPRASGIYQLFGDQIDCGALMGWAWGISRVIDALETIPEIDITKVVVTGHSRNGKGAIVAGSFDERVALTVPSHSGSGGAAPYRFLDAYAERNGKAETLQNVVGYAPHWFRPDFKQFVGNVDRLPVDQHLLRALVTPRALLSTEGTKDAWTNPEGAQLMHQSAKKVYDFLKAGDKISIRFRPVGHIPSNEDLLDYANYVFFGKSLSEDFGKLAYQQETKAYTWDGPK